ncbi:MAG: hypothetical protein ACHREM_08705 [Polyangiales bacterium]
MTFRRPLSTIFAIAAVACGGNVQFGAADASATDSGGDAADATSSDAACVNSIQGASCSKGDVPCDAGGDRCCIGYVWACIAVGPSGAMVWTKEGLGCACVADAAVDAPSDVSHVDANPASCPVTWTAATTGNHDGLCATTIVCGYAEGSCTCEGFCGGIAIPDADLSPHWACTPNRTDGCSDATPKDGDPCAVAGQACTYGPCCVTTYTCTSGHWKAGPMACPG